MIHDVVILFLIIDAAAVTLSIELPEEQLFSHFQHDIIELVKHDTHC